MNLLIGALFILVGLPVLFFCLAAVGRGVYRREMNQDEIHWLTASDGWRLALHHYLPQDQKKKNPQVLLVHGYGGNAMNFDSSPRQSLPLYLVEQGFEVWALDLRGAGYSNGPQKTFRLGLDYDFDDYIKKDLPAAIDYLTERSGGPIHYIGHSMGGMIAYSFLPTDLGQKIKAAVILSSPARLEHFHFPGQPLAASAVKVLPAIPLALFFEAISFIMERLEYLHKLIGFQKDNLYPGDAAAFAANNNSNPSARLTISMARWAEIDATGRGVCSYKADLEKITLPMLFMVGRGDQTGPSGSVKHAYERVSSKDKTFIMAGKPEGFSFDYRHVDILIGRRSREEIYPLIADWLKKHS